MLPLQGYNGIQCHQSLHDDQELGNGVKNNKINSLDPSSSSSGGFMRMMITKPPSTTESASERHALSERKRRKRINSHYDSLRQLFPQLHKTDKASVLTETVRRLKELRNMVADMAQANDDGEGSGGGERRLFFLPGENDELTVSESDGGNKMAVRVTICCEERPGLYQDLSEAIHSVRGKAVKAEMGTVGGRTKVVVAVEWPEGGGCKEQDVGSLRRALRAVVENRTLGCTGFMGLRMSASKWAGLGKELGSLETPKMYNPLKSGLADGLILKTS